MLLLLCSTFFPLFHSLFYLLFSSFRRESTPPPLPTMPPLIAQVFNEHQLNQLPILGSVFGSEHRTITFHRGFYSLGGAVANKQIMYKKNSTDIAADRDEYVK